jgi:nitrite reductase/ring-hydroxylating ferredoxin subunit
MPASDSETGSADPDLFAGVERAIAALEAHADPAVREALRALLEGIDGVHRAGLTHLVQGIQGMAGDAFLNRLVSDPAIRLLLMSYNLVAVDRRLLAEEALDTVRGHLHDHGIDVEIVEVVGGVVYVRLHHPPRAGSHHQDIALDAIRRDLEAALQAEFVGFQELVFRDRDTASAPSLFIPLDGLKKARRPIYEDVLALDDLPIGSMRPVQVKGVSILLVNVADEIHAIRNQCGDSPLPLEFGTLSGSELRCSWHGCRYDVRSGRRLDDDQVGAQVFPVAIAEDRIRIAVGVEAGGEI